ncbi:hypothetical protein BZB76_6588 [Actinomadura pelletieri DSM 43383]|uniref:Uncharacterized protein n=1 Tax=Actinomadura pelletieri DSM 43383 TaxID=1120940 RepID=A0A495QA28_9ACTN|nr:hypothetical protein [Actinomadura pelletieri]RKS68325.1 hypothetical protein BZB76_6588 [Actinomadura pelletieri DSM 43383]
MHDRHQAKGAEIRAPRSGPRAAGHPPPAQGLLGLQSAAGNAAVVQMLGNADRSEPVDGHVVQRSPATWMQSEAVTMALQQTGGMTPSSRWPAVTQAVRAYGRLAPNDLSGRAAALDALSQAIGNWRQNQETVRHRAPWSSANARQAAVSALEDLIRRERDEIRGQRQTPSGPAEPAPPSAAMSIPMGGSRAGDTMPGHGGSLDDSDRSWSPTPDLNEGGVVAKAEARKNAAPLPARVRVRLHLTTDSNVGGVHQRGLKPSQGSGGIGVNPEPGMPADPDPHHFYVLTGSNQKNENLIASQAGVRAVLVLSSDSVSYDKDVNYPDGGAGRYAGEAPAARSARGESRTRGPISVVLPLRASGTTTDEVTNFVNQLRDQGEPPLTTREVIERIEGELIRRYGIFRVADHLS